MALKLFSACGLLCWAALVSAASAHNTPQLIIVIDDIGNNYQLGKRIVDIPAPMTLAFLPHTPFAARLAQESHLSGKDNILHAPMENSVAAPLGPGALTQHMTEQEFLTTLQNSIAAIPHVQGINNHMGSALTQLQQPMNWVMKTLKQQQLYFIDSLTTSRSVGFGLARQHQIPVLRRDVFLDNDVSATALEKQWQQALRIANTRGHAVVIGHPYAETSAFLQQAISELEGIELISASEFILRQAWHAFASNEALPYNRYWLNQQEKIQRIDNNKNQKQSQYDATLISQLP